jgi:hypothetical protein
MSVVNVSALRYPHLTKKDQTKGDYKMQQIIAGNDYAGNRTLLLLIYHCIAAP